MKTILLQADAANGMSQAALAGGMPSLTQWSPAKVATWLPVPAARPQSKTRPVGRAKSMRTARTNIWIAPPRTSLGERVCYGTLAAAALASVAYGFSMLIDLAANWTVLQNYVSQLAQ